MSTTDDSPLSDDDWCRRHPRQPWRLRRPRRGDPPGTAAVLALNAPGVAVAALPADAPELPRVFRPGPLSRREVLALHTRYAVRWPPFSPLPPPSGVTTRTA